MPVDPGIPGQPLSLKADSDKAFLYVRYSAELAPSGLAELGLRKIDARRTRKMGDVENVDDLTKIDDALSGKVDLRHIGVFATTRTVAAPGPDGSR